MAFKTGHKKFGGRIKGTPNKKSQDLMAKCDARGIDVFDAMLELAIEASEPFQKFSVLRELANYLYPKRKAVEVSGDIDLTLAKEAQENTLKTNEELVELMEAEIKRLQGK